MKIIFRKFKNDNSIIAFFPEQEEYNDKVMSYMHNGQHAPADYKGLLKSTVLATPNEYFQLYRKLENIYDDETLVVQSRFESRIL